MEKHPGGRPRKYNSPEELQKKIDEYFEYCDTYNKPYTMTGLANACDMERASIINYGKNELFYSTIAHAKRKVQQYAEEQLYRESGSVNGIVFNLKNNFGWRDQQDINANLNTIQIEVKRDED